MHISLFLMQQKGKQMTRSEKTGKKRKLKTLTLFSAINWSVTEYISDCTKKWNYEDGWDGFIGCWILAGLRQNEHLLYILWYSTETTWVVTFSNSYGKLHLQCVHMETLSVGLLSEQQSVRSSGITMVLVFSILCSSFILNCIPRCFPRPCSEYWIAAT